MTMTTCGSCAEPVTDGYLCRRCTNQTAARLGSIADNWADLQTTITRQDQLGPQDERPTQRAVPTALLTSTDDPEVATRLLRMGAPAKMHAADVARQVRAFLHGDRTTAWSGWVAHVALHVRRTPAGTSVRSACTFLATYVDRYRLVENAGQLAIATRDLDLKIQKTIDLPKNRSTIFVGPCPEVVQGERQQVPCPGELWAAIPQETDAPPTITCRACRRTWSSWEWTRLGRRVHVRTKSQPTPQSA
ncbi:hypothetical protein [Auraticoccus monumenti]|uniref:Uncharacterized protein n=1 Tax=Auraticoccus monumenti TaxID=675864 RepID=A0A1G6UMP3_9ACTN|nr:hypothetical protein [Auraticoccus monumenti]SDD42559.1 hypothetical protein SAMN04489747_0922 [Auraticoccus monumenti]